MNISYNWLKEYVACELPAEDVAQILTSIGLEVGGVEEVQTIKGGLKGLVVGEVLTCEAHPNSDHLHVCMVDLGNNEAPSQIVCGAPNVAKGQKVVVATLGTILYAGEETFTIKKSKLRGVESHGMLCGENEIGVGQDTSGIIVLPADTPVGMLAADYYKVSSDYLIEVDITPNRSDACSHYGVARDLYAWLTNNGHSTTLQRWNEESFKIDNNNLPIAVTVKDTEACPHYCALTISDIEVKESPKWLQDKLRTIGIRPINNIVDATNYVMFAYGQPLHCFDADKIKGREIIVQTLPEGTNFVTLDGEERKLSSADLMICDAEGPLCIAGVLGGKDSGTYEGTKNILLESAYFHPTWVRKSARRHGLNTDASFRFERGIDPNIQVYALQIAAILIQEIAGGSVSMPMFDSRPTAAAGFTIDLDYTYVNDLIGKELPKDTVKNILTSLEVKIIAESAEALHVEVPPYRVDVKRPCDLVEDILRIYGYNNVELPTTLNGSPSFKGKEDYSYDMQNLISEQLIGAGFTEILNNSLSKADYYAENPDFPQSQSVTLLNALSNDLSTMRQTLLYGGLETIARNSNRQHANLALYEFGNTYTKQDAATADRLDNYHESFHLGLWLTGKRVEGSWAHTNEPYSFYELKAHVNNVLVRLGINLDTIQTTSSSTQATFSDILIYTDKNNNVLAEIGQVAPTLLKAFGLTAPVFYATIYWTNTLALAQRHHVSFTEISKFPSVSRDLALLVDTTTDFAQIEAVIKQSERKLLKSVELFDVYEGKNLPAGKKSYAVNCILQDTSKTLNEKQIEKIMSNIVTNLQKQLNAQLR